MTRDPIITRWSEPSERFPGFMASKTGKTTELVVAEYSEAGQAGLKAELASRAEAQRIRDEEARALKQRPELIEGEPVAQFHTGSVATVARDTNV